MDFVCCFVAIEWRRQVYFERIRTRLGLVRRFKIIGGFLDFFPLQFTACSKPPKVSYPRMQQGTAGVLSLSHTKRKA